MRAFLQWHETCISKECSECCTLLEGDIMPDQMTYRRAKKLNAVFILLLFATDRSDTDPALNKEDNSKPSEGPAKSPEYYEEKMKEFERNKFRF